MKLSNFNLSIQTQGRGIYDITQNISSLIAKADITEGLCNIFIKHTSASLIICENYSDDVLVDLENFLKQLVVDGDPLFKHTIEGDDDMPAHIRSMLTNVDLSIPIEKAQLSLGTWQGIMLYEHRYNPHNRNMVVTIMGT